MKAVVQRVSRASVSVEGAEISRIGMGMLVLLGVAEGDVEEDLDWLVRKTASIRIFNDEAGVMNLDIRQVQGEVLVVSQFTLLASTKKGNRPSYVHAAKPNESEPMYELFCNRMAQAVGTGVATGLFGADMKVELLNDGPVTIILDSRHRL